ncbi:MAG: hypothetical protein ABIV47_19660 [Roseiflexaceae bacterium]
MAKINFNGQEYDSPAAMPPEVRQLYQMMTSMLTDRNQDGLPDIFVSGTDDGAPTLFQTTQFVVDGKAYSNLDELPPEARQKYEQALGRFDTNHNGIPDLLEHSRFGAVAQPPAAPPSPQPYQEPKITVIGDSPSANRASIMLATGALAVLLIVIAAIYLLSR